MSAFKKSYYYWVTNSEIPTETEMKSAKATASQVQASGGDDDDTTHGDARWKFEVKEKGVGKLTIVWRCGEM